MKFVRLIFLLMASAAGALLIAGVCQFEPASAALASHADYDALHKTMSNRELAMYYRANAKKSLTRADFDTLFAMNRNDLANLNNPLALRARPRTFLLLSLMSTYRPVGNEERLSAEQRAAIRDAAACQGDGAELIRESARRILAHFS